MPEDVLREDSPIDLREEFKYSREPEQPTERVVIEKTEVDKLRSDYEEKITRANREADEARRDADRWASMARRTPERAEPREEPTARKREAASEEKPDKFLDDLSAEGIKALHKRGMITQDQLEEALGDAVENVRAEMEEKTEAQAFDAKLSSQFPELWSDNEKMNAWKAAGERGPKPVTSELYRKTGEIFLEQVREAGIDPESKAARGLLITAARMAKRELGVKEPTNERADRERERRERIDGQSRPAGRAGDDFETGGGKQITGVQRSIMKSLGVSPETFQKFSGAGKGEHKHDRSTR